MTSDELSRLAESWRAGEQQFVDDINEKFRRYDVVITALINVLFSNKLTTPEQFSKLVIQNSALVDQAAAYLRDKEASE